MRKLFALPLLLLLCASVSAQSQSVTQLPTTTSPAATDKLFIVTDPAGAKNNRAITVASLLGNNGLTAVNVKAPAFGAVGNARHVDDAAINVGVSATTLTSATAGFTASDVGRTVSIKGAGAAGVTLITTIASRTNSTTVTLTAAASTTVTSKRLIIGTNDTSAIASAVSAASGRALYFPTGTYLIRMTATSGGAMVIPTGTTIIGDGAGSVIYVIGSDGAAAGGADDDGKAALFVAASAKKVTIAGLHFIGENGPFSEPINNLSRAIALGASSEDVTVRDCVFEDLFGFSVVDNGAVTRPRIIGNTLLNCANGLNVNSDGVQYIENTLYNSEGIETSAAQCLVMGNRFIDCTGAGGAFPSLSIGGNTTPATTTYGIKVIGNTFDNDAGAPMLIADASTDVVIADNTMHTWRSLGGSLPAINITSSGTNPIANVLISHNTISNNGTRTGIIVTSASVSLITIDGNIITGVGYPISALGSAVRITSNTLQGTSADLLPGPSTYVHGNRFSSPAVFDFSNSGASFTADSDQKGPNVASAATIAPSGCLFHVTGTTGISAISTTAVQSGTTIAIIFDGVLTITHGSSLKLAGSVNFTTTADTRMQFSYDGSAWREVSRVQP